MNEHLSWLLHHAFYTDEAIPRRKFQPLPPLLQEARALEARRRSYYSDAVLFYQEGMLLADYTDDTVFYDVRSLYCPTYSALDDQELRGYFGWRTRARAGRDENAPLTYLFMYIYELLNNIGVENPRGGYKRLLWVIQHYGERAPKILPYLRRWIYDYVIFYALPVELLPKQPRDETENALLQFSHVAELEPAQVIEAVKALAPRWLRRSRFYAENSADMDEVIVGVLRGYAAHCAKNKAKSNILNAFSSYLGKYYYDLMASAVFCKRPRPNTDEYRISSIHYFSFEQAECFEHTFSDEAIPKKIDDLMKYIDGQMRKTFADAHPIQQPSQPKWVVALVDAEIAALCARKNAAKPLVFDAADLARIRADAAVTQARLAVADEIEAEALPASPPPAPAAPEEAAAPLCGGLTAPEARYLRALLRGESTDWVRAAGLLPSVLADSINDKLYDAFGDTVLAPEGDAVLDDYADELKEALGL